MTTSIGTAIKQYRQMSQDELAIRLHISRELVSAIETGRRSVPRDIAPKLAREIDDNAVYLEMRREYTGTGPVYLDNIDDHRLACVLKCAEEMEEAQEMMMHRLLPTLIRARDGQDLTDEERADIKAACLEMCEAITAAENALARLAKCYGISLAELWDEHEAELVAKGYLKKQKAAR